jgi:hypothetical protein
MKVAQHAKQQTRKSKDALMAHAMMAKALISAKRMAEVKLEMQRLNERPMYYRLNDDHSVSAIRGRLSDPNGRDVVLAWGREFEDLDKRVVARDDVDGCLVSTIFLGLDHAWGDGPPILFETMAFSAATKRVELLSAARDVHETLHERRYATYDEALAGHAEVLAEVKATVAKLNELKGKDE